MAPCSCSISVKGMILSTVNLQGVDIVFCRYLEVEYILFIMLSSMWRLDVGQPYFKMKFFLNTESMSDRHRSIWCVSYFWLLQIEITFDWQILFYNTEFQIHVGQKFPILWELNLIVRYSIHHEIGKAFHVFLFTVS